MNVIDRRIPQILIALILASALSWQCIGAWQDSQTTDEAVHLVAGRSYWQTGNFLINPEHPSLFKLWAAGPLALLPRTEIQSDTAIWRSGNEWLIGAQYLYGGTAQFQYGGRWLLFWGRMPMVVMWLGLVIALTWWSWCRWGPWPATAVAGTIAFDPNILGHGHLITNDLAAAFAWWGMFVVLGKFIDRPDWKRFWWVTVVFGLAQLTKFSEIILWVLVPLVLSIAIFYRRPGVNWKWWWRTILGCAVMTMVLLTASYGFRFERIGDDPRVAQLWNERQEVVARQNVAALPGPMQVLVHLSDPQTVSGRWLKQFENARVPAYAYWRGLITTITHNIYGHQAYLFGQGSMSGWWYYFPVALFFKAPILLLILSALALLPMVHFLRQHRLNRGKIPFDVWLFVFPPLLYFLWSMSSHINIGIRHIFPSYIYLPLAIGSVMAWIGRHHPRQMQWLVLATVTTSLAVSLNAWPNTIGYVNAFGGGTYGGHRYLLDSNIDWNQDIWRLRSFIGQQRLTQVHIALFGSIPTANVFPEQLQVLYDRDITAGSRPSGVVAISQGLLYLPDSPFTWLRSYEPRWRIGSSIFVYDFR